MLGPVNKLGFKGNLYKGLKITIDNQELLDILDEAVKSCTKQFWIEKKDAAVNVTELNHSADKSGRYSLLWCRGCQTIEDILMEEIEVEHHDDYITWAIIIPGYDIYHDNHEKIRFKFHKPQYIKAINALLKNTAYNL